MTSLSNTSLVEARDLVWRGPLPAALLDGVDLSLGIELVGVVGDNGAGKTTLLRLLAGELESERGSVVRRGRLAFLRQDAFSRTRGSVADALGKGAEVEALERLARGRGTPADSAVVDGAWDVRDRIRDAMHAVGLHDIDPTRDLKTLSGGERARAAIAAALIDDPAVLLLDEPTNHLDEGSREAVCEALRRLDKGILVVTHDRALLSIVDRILEVRRAKVRSFGGSFEAFASARRRERERAEERLFEAERAARQARKDMARAIERKAKRDARGKRQRAKGGQAKSLLDLQKERSQKSAGRLGRLESRVLEKADDKLSDARTRVDRTAPLAFDVEATRVPTGALVLSVERAIVTAPGAARPLLDDVSLYVRGPERLAITGDNGAGKSTLLGLLAGIAEPMSGEVRVSVAEVAFVDQHAGALRDEDTLVEALARRWPSSTLGQRRERLAAFSFLRARAFDRVATLSGGERVRASLACALSGERPPQLLLLDEPTNHLDLPSVEAVARVLRSFAGAIIVVSHDRAFREDIGVSRELRLQAGRVVADERARDGNSDARDTLGDDRSSS